MDNYILTLIVFLPVAGALIAWLIPKSQEFGIRLVSLLTMAAGLVLGLVLWFMFDPGSDALQFAGLKLHWFSVSNIPIHYQFGVDGISLLLVELTLLLGPLVILSSWTAVTERVKEYHIFLLLLQTGMLGALLAMDLFLFYVFWEIMLIPMYFLIGVWGGKRRLYATIKFFLFTMAGSMLMLVAILYLALLPEKGSFDIVTVAANLNPGHEVLSAGAQYLLFGAFALAFAIKVPMFPFHTWLPDAHVEAPTAGSVILAGVLLKMGTYGFVRFAMPFFPYAAMQAIPIIWTLSVIGIIYGALVAMVQPDVKKLVAYSSVSHLGFVMLGLFAMNTAGVQGSILQMVNHGLSTGALFLIVGVVYERRHTRMISDFGGLAKVVPLYAVFFMLATLSSIGLPGLNGFVGEFLILAGTYTADHPWGKIMAVLAASGVIFAACYMLWMYQRVMFGPVTKKENKDLKDLNLREVVYLLALMVFIVWIGIYPKTFLSRTQASVDSFIVNFEQRYESARQILEYDEIHGGGGSDEAEAGEDHGNHGDGN